MPDDLDRLDAPLAALAAALDREASPVSPAEAIAAASAPVLPRRRQRVALVGVTAAFAIVVGLLAWVARDDTDDDSELISPAPDVTTTTAAGFDFMALPDEGIAVQPLDGPLRLYDLDGASLGTAPALVGTHNEPRLEASSPDFQAERPATVQVPSGCQSAEARGGRWVALCGGETQRPSRIDLIDTSGEAALLYLDVYTFTGVGHWTSASPSPDGRTVLAQWSGECESPRAFLIDVATGGVGAIGAPARKAPGPESRALGWGEDGRAVVELLSGSCGIAADTPGVYLVDPRTGDLELIVAVDTVSDQTFLWTGMARGNGIEKLFFNALADAGIESGSSGEPSHGGPGVTSGARFEGHDIQIYGAPTDDPTAGFGWPSWDLVPFHGSQAMVASGYGDGAPPDDPVTFVRFTCGVVTWRLSWNEASTDPSAMLRLAERLVPFLGCSVGPAPETQTTSGEP